MCHGATPQWRHSKWLTATTRPPHLEIIRCWEYLWYPQNILSDNQCRNNALLTLNFMLLENAPCVECMDKGLCFLLKHRNIIATAYWILLLKPSLVISQGQPCWHTFHALMSAKNKRPINCVKRKLTPLYFHSSHAWYAWLLYNKIQQFFWECVLMHECNNNFAFPLHSSFYAAVLNIHCFFFPLVYKDHDYFHCK